MTEPIKRDPMHIVYSKTVKVQLKTKCACLLMMCQALEQLLLMGTFAIQAGNVDQKVQLEAADACQDFEVFLWCCIVVMRR